MYHFIPLLLTLASVHAADHADANHVYCKLLPSGVTVGPKLLARRAPPTLPDGLDARAQQAVLRKVAGEDYSVEELVRKSAVAPHVLRLRDVKPADPKAPARGVDVWFVAHGELDRV